MRAAPHPPFTLPYVLMFETPQAIGAINATDSKFGVLEYVIKRAATYEEWVASVIEIHGHAPAKRLRQEMIDWYPYEIVVD